MRFFVGLVLVALSLACGSEKDVAESAFKAVRWPGDSFGGPASSQLASIDVDPPSAGTVLLTATGTCQALVNVSTGPTSMAVAIADTQAALPSDAAPTVFWPQNAWTGTNGPTSTWVVQRTIDVQTGATTKYLMAYVTDSTWACLDGDLTAQFFASDL